MCRGIWRRLAGVLVDELSLTAIGVNHCTWITEVARAAESLWPAIERTLEANPPEMPEPEDPFAGAAPFSWELYDAHGAFPAVLDRHVTEFYPAICRADAYYGRTLGVDAYHASRGRFGRETRPSPRWRRSATGRGRSIQTFSTMRRESMSSSSRFWRAWPERGRRFLREPSQQRAGPWRVGRSDSGRNGLIDERGHSPSGRWAGIACNTRSDRTSRRGRRAVPSMRPCPATSTTWRSPSTRRGRVTRRMRRERWRENWSRRKARICPNFGLANR